MYSAFEYIYYFVLNGDATAVLLFISTSVCVITIMLFLTCLFLGLLLSNFLLLRRNCSSKFRLNLK